MKETQKKPAKQANNRDSGGRFVSGFSGNLKGRPKGLSIREQIRKYLENHPKAVEKMVKYFVKENPELTWQMLEGRPPNGETLAQSRPLQVIIPKVVADRAGIKEGVY